MSNAEDAEGGDDGVERGGDEGERVTELKDCCCVCDILDWRGCQ